MSNQYTGNAPPTMIDLFAGCGGVTQAFKNFGFNVIAAVEFDPAAAATFRTNHPEVLLFEEDIRGIKIPRIFEECDLKPNELTVLSICAPCQPFSRQNKSDKKDSRTNLVLQTIRFVKYLRPRYIFMENVAGLAKGKNKPILDALVKALSFGLGYNLLEPTILDGADFGIPQHRERLFLLGSREQENLTLPAKTHFKPELARKMGGREWRTVREAFSGISRLASGQRSSTDYMHKARRHTALNLERLRHIPKNGGSRSSLPKRLQLECHKKGTGYNDVYGRLDLDKLANTLTTGCTNFTKGRFAHPTANRAITPREAARLQTFPDTYIFEGTYDQISTQIGNAVPVRFAEAFSRHLLSYSIKS